MKRVRRPAGEPEPPQELQEIPLSQVTRHQREREAIEAQPFDDPVPSSGRAREYLPEPMPPPETMPKPKPPPESLPEPMPDDQATQPQPEYLPEPMPGDETWTGVHKLPGGISPLRPEPRNSGCAPKAVALALVLVGLLAAIWFGTRPKAEPTVASNPVASPQAKPEGAAQGGAPAPPDPQEGPPGTELFTGRSGGPIGHIAADGQSRFLSLERPGVGVGNAAIPEKTTKWKQDGEVVSFGVTFNTKRNRGRYGINLFRNGTEYSAGCAVEVGQTGCEFPGNGARLKAGDELVIIIGEQGHIKETGDFALRWWFRFKPD